MKDVKFPTFLKEVTGHLSSGADLLGLQVTAEPIERKKKLVSITFEFASPRRTGAPPDDLGGGWINGHLEPGFFRRRRIFNYLLRTIKEGMREYPFFIQNGQHGVRMARVYEQCSHAMKSSSLTVTIYFESWRGITEKDQEERVYLYNAKDFGITLPNAEVIYG
jgi:hypothetical protein